MKTITVKLEDELANAVERVQKDAGFRTKSEMIREGLRVLIARERRRKLAENLTRYLRDREALDEAAQEVEERMPSTEEALKRSEP
jgi:metal-responsive CopG/Arc/MetJ family transcriptional regulator